MDRLNNMNRGVMVDVEHSIEAYTKKGEMRLEIATVNIYLSLPYLPATDIDQYPTHYIDD
jgi:hypothetical protein